MRRLIVVRHAKSDWSHPELGDHDRPLNGRGQTASKQLGAFLTRIATIPDLVLTSTAVRAHDTAKLASEAGQWPSPIQATRALYEVDASSAIRCLREQSPDVETILLVAHEPCCSELISDLVGGADIQLPTAAASLIDLQIEDWSKTAIETGTLRWLVIPKIL